MPGVRSAVGVVAALSVPVVAVGLLVGVPGGVSSAAAGPALPNACMPVGATTGSAKPCPASPRLGWSRHREVPWHLTAASSTMYRLTYNGVVTVPTASGPVRALDFTADSADLVGMVTWAPLSGTSVDVHNDAGRASSTHLTGVHLHVTRLSGAMFGLLGVTFTPDRPPPLIPGVPTPIPVVFTGVSQDNLELDAATLNVPGYTVKISR